MYCDRQIEVNIAHMTKSVIALAAGASLAASIWWLLSAPARGQDAQMVPVAAGPVLLGSDDGPPDERGSSRARHDAATLLGVVTGYAELLRLDPAASERERAALAAARRASADALGC